MCSQYTQKVERTRVLETLKIIKENGIFTQSKVLPYGPSLVIHAEANGLVTDTMQFCLVPSWSKEPKVKFATHNARLETVDQKPTFKEAFVKRHCVIPMDSFIEPIYLNELAGNMIAFTSRDPMYATGIWEEWVSQKTGEILNSFAILTSEPLPYVGKVGHDRSPVFLEPKNVETWLKNEGEKPKELKKFLLDHLYHPDFYTEIDRPMAKGWQKRIPKL